MAEEDAAEAVLEGDLGGETSAFGQLVVEKGGCLYLACLFAAVGVGLYLAGPGRLGGEWSFVPGKELSGGVAQFEPHGALAAVPVGGDGYRQGQFLLLPLCHGHVGLRAGGFLAARREEFRGKKGLRNVPVRHRHKRLHRFSRGRFVGAGGRHGGGVARIPEDQPAHHAVHRMLDVGLSGRPEFSHQHGAFSVGAAAKLRKCLRVHRRGGNSGRHAPGVGWQHGLEARGDRFLSLGDELHVFVDARLVRQFSDFDHEFVFAGCGFRPQREDEGFIPFVVFADEFAVEVYPGVLVHSAEEEAEFFFGGLRYDDRFCVPGGAVVAGLDFLPVAPCAELPPSRSVVGGQAPFFAVAFLVRVLDEEPIAGEVGKDFLAGDGTDFSGRGFPRDDYDLSVLVFSQSGVGQHAGPVDVEFSAAFDVVHDCFLQLGGEVGGIPGPAPGVVVHGEDKRLRGLGDRTVERLKQAVLVLLRHPTAHASVETDLVRLEGLLVEIILDAHVLPPDVDPVPAGDRDPHRWQLVRGRCRAERGRNTGGQNQRHHHKHLRSRHLTPPRRGEL